MNRFPALSVAVIGAGLAGAACAHALRAQGHAVQVFDKSRGPGGRLATRRMVWTDRDGLPHSTPMDHGCVALSARSPAFQGFLAQATQAGWVAPWAPHQRADSLPLPQAGPLWVPVPDQPSLCHHLLGDARTTWSCAVDGLQRTPQGWQVWADGALQTSAVDGVLLALPPAQAAPLLQAHRSDWARHAALVPMQAGWTLMAVTDDELAPAGDPAADPVAAWTVHCPPHGPLAWVLRQDARPGRTPVPGQAHWVAHARGGWSRRHMAQKPEWVQQQLQDALAEALGRAVVWRHSVVHRWRYALPPQPPAQPTAACWWDAAQGLGVCGDFLGGVGAEGAWLSAQALVQTLLQAPPPLGSAPEQPLPAEAPPSVAPAPAVSVCEP
ncbi:MAG: hypothetical protein RJA98_3445 [Pseudomonadota bacterium]